MLRTLLLIAVLFHPGPAAAQETPSSSLGEGGEIGNGLFLAASGAVGALLVFPGAWGGYAIGDRLSPAPRYCDIGGCDVGFPWGGALGVITGGLLGGAGGAGLGVAIAGSLVGGRFHWFPAALGGAVGLLGGAALGGLVAPYFTGFFPFFSVGLLGAAGAGIGALVGYHLSQPWPRQIIPVVALVPGGGGVVGIAGRF